MKNPFSHFLKTSLVLSLCTLSMLSIIIITPMNVQAFGSLTENGTAAFMGIGTVPQKILHVSGSGPGSVPLFSRGSDSAGFIIERTPTNRWVLGVNESPALGNGFVLSTIPFGTTSVPRLMITPDGKVGIGTTSPYQLSKLHVVNDNTTTGAMAIYGVSNSANTYGVGGESTNGEGVYGKNTSTGNYGWLGSGKSGVYGYSIGSMDAVDGYSSGSGCGISGYSFNGIGVFGMSGNSTSYAGKFIGNVLIQGSENVTENLNVKGKVNITENVTLSDNLSVGGNVGIGTTSPTNGKLDVEVTKGTAVYGRNNAGGGFLDSGVGVYGSNTASLGSGVYGYSAGLGNGVSGDSPNGYGVRGSSTSGYAGYFDGNVKINGSLATNYTLPTADPYTATATDSIIAVDASGGARYINLPTAAGITGKAYTIKIVADSGHAVTIDPYISERIDGDLSYSMNSEWQFVTIVSDGANWLIVGKGP